MIDRHLREAIAARRLVRLAYKGKTRVAEPHDYGVQNGKTRLLVYQLRVAGQPEGPKTRGWRLLDVDGISDCSVLDETFRGSRGQSHNDHLAWEVVYARVS